jgi:tRNA G46 methylase TrmB
MTGNSRGVSSTQLTTHPRLGPVVLKHLSTGSRRPLPAHSVNAFEELRCWAEQSSRPLILDSFCGTGMSTALIAAAHPDCRVIGLDKSAARLDKHVAGPGDYRLVRTDCGDFWRLAAAAGWRLSHHFLLYPNPWPKPVQLQRRVHGIPEFANLLQLGGRLELRSNWQVYVEEFGTALNIAGKRPLVQRLQPGEPLSLHERKYSRSQHELWRCICQLRDNSRS